MNINTFIQTAMIKKQRYVLADNDNEPFYVKKFSMADREAMVEFVNKYKTKDKKISKEQQDAKNTLIAIYAQMIYGIINEDNTPVFTEDDYANGNMAQIPENWIMGMLVAITQYNTTNDMDIIKK